MSVKQRDIRAYGSASMLVDNVSTGEGGVISTSTSVQFSDMGANDNIQIVSSSAADTVPTVTVTGRSASGAIITEVKTLAGLTAVPATTNTVWMRLLKAVKSATCAGDVAVEQLTAATTATAVGGAAPDQITLAAGASAVAQAYQFMIIRITAGTGVGQIRQIVDYTTGKVATVSADWATTPDGTSVYKISNGFLLQKAPSEIMTAQRIFYAASSDVAGGSARVYYEKIFLKNDHATLALTQASVIRFADPLGKITFALATANNDAGTNGASTRLVIPPSGVTAFGTATLNVPGGQLNPGDAIGVWLALTLNPGDAPNASTYSTQVTGQTI